MKEASEDWLSCTMRTVEKVMERHGFQKDGGKMQAPPKPISDEQLSTCSKILRAGFPFRAAE